MGQETRGARRWRSGALAALATVGITAAGFGGVGVLAPSVAGAATTTTVAKHSTPPKTTAKTTTTTLKAIPPTTKVVAQPSVDHCYLSQAAVSWLMRLPEGAGHWNGKQCLFKTKSGNDFGILPWKAKANCKVAHSYTVGKGGCVVDVTNLPVHGLIYAEAGTRVIILGWDSKVAHGPALHVRLLQAGAALVRLMEKDPKVT